jgi:acetyl-CoA carboxylase beta subunit
MGGVMNCKCVSTRGYKEGICTICGGIDTQDLLTCPNPKCNGELLFVDRWDITHNKAQCAKCRTFYHLINEENYYLWMDKLNEDKLTRRNRQIEELKKKIKQYQNALSYERAMPNDQSIMEEPEV